MTRDPASAVGLLTVLLWARIAADHQVAAQRGSAGEVSEPGKVV